MQHLHAPDSILVSLFRDSLPQTLTLLDKFNNLNAVFCINECKEIKFNAAAIPQADLTRFLILMIKY